MMDAAQAIFAAQSVLASSPEYAAACELCRLRGFNPQDPIMSVTGLPPCNNVQWIIAEQILEQNLRIAFKESAGASILRRRMPFNA